MKKQRKQLIILGILLVVVIAAFVGVKMIPEESEEVEETAKITVFDVDTSTINSYEYTNENGSLTFAKDGDQWNYNGDAGVDIDESIIETMINNIATLKAETQIDDAKDLSIYGLDDVQKAVTIENDETYYRIYIGDYNDITSTYYIATDDHPYTVFAIDGSTLSIYDDTLEDLLAEGQTLPEDYQTNEDDLTDGIIDEILSDGFTITGEGSGN